MLAYSIWYRRHEKYVGHVWQGRFTSRLVESEVQLAENIRYIHANPVRAGMVKEEIDYKWSSAQCWGDYKRADNKVYGLDIVCGDTSDVS